MIVYNNRYRGPMEYDKFILNILQYSNEINMILKNEFYNSESQKTFKKMCEQLEALYQQTIKRSEELSLLLTDFKEV